MQKKIHIIIYNFEPIFKDGRVNRTKYLVDFFLKKGYEVHVYTLGNKDKVLNVKENYVIHQVKSKILSKIINSKDNKKTKENKKWYFSFLRMAEFLIPFDRYFTSFLSMRKVVSDNINSDDKVLISVPYFSTLLNILWLTKNKNLVVDFRDLLVGNRIFSKNLVSDYLYNLIQNYLLKNVNFVLVTTDSALGRFKKIKKRYVLKNGISESELKTLQEIKKTNDLKNKYDLIYFGNLGNKRDALPFFKILNELGVTYRVYGNVDDRHMNVIGGNFGGFLNTIEMYENILSAKVVFVIILPDEHSQYAIPGKIYQAMATGKKIILYTDKKSASLKLLENLEYPFLFINCSDPINSIEISRCIKSKYNDSPKIILREKEFENNLYKKW